MFQLDGLGRESMKVATYDVQVSAKQPIPLPTGSLRSDSEGLDSWGWQEVTGTLDHVGSRIAIILLLHGCDGPTTDIWSLRRLKDHYKSISAEIKNASIRALNLALRPLEHTMFLGRCRVQIPAFQRAFQAKSPYLGHILGITAPYPLSG